MALPHPGGIDGLLTVSIGVAAGSGDVGRLLACADAALYEPKDLGRNRVAAAGDTTVPLTIRRLPPSASEEPIPRHRRGMLIVSRAAASGRGEIPVLDALARAIRSELSFQVVAVNLVDRERTKLRVVVVLGDEEAREMLLDSVNPWREWELLIESDHVRCDLAPGRVLRFLRRDQDLDGVRGRGTRSGFVASRGHVAASPPRRERGCSASCRSTSRSPAGVPTTRS
jgi:hypothetical protein